MQFRWICVIGQDQRIFSSVLAVNINIPQLPARSWIAINTQVDKLVKILDFIMKFEKGYEEEVGEGGNLLSVGQKQLISLARAVLSKPEIFIMDEATSSVDTLTEALIQQGMEHLMQRCTTFVIAHRLSTIKNADRILVIENGQIAEIGTHSELLRRKGKYFNLYTKQREW